MTFICKQQPCVNHHEYCNTGMCKYHYLYGGDKPEKKKEIKPIPRESKKRAKENREDQKQNRELRQKNPYCQMKTPVCTGLAQGIQHKKGRIGKDLTDIKQKLTSCNACNRWVEEHPKEAQIMGLAIPKHRKNN